ARESSWREMLPDNGAGYDRVIEINLSELVPMIAQPHSPDNVVTISSIKGMKVDQVAVGSCTNSSYKDLMTIAGILKGKKVHPEVSFLVAPGSRQVFEMIAQNGALADIIASGARIMESACGFCIGAGAAPKTGSISLRTNNRNFEGRSGTQSASIYLVSPETAALSALKGELVDPLDYPAGEYPSVAMPEQFLIDDSMIIPPSETDDPVFRGPNIGEPPYTGPLMDEMNGVIGLKVGDKITTDHIMPAGQRLKYRSNIPEYSKYVFENVDADFSSRSLKNREEGRYTAIMGGESYGQGSSREHAAICPMFLGVRFVIAKSFERIHTSNLINFGILPLVFKNSADYDAINQGDSFSAHNLRAAVKAGTDITLVINGTSFAFSLIASSRQREILLDGGLLNFTKKNI
ncbi:MAG TPA: aconitase family protein, partial [Spirochaetota bacterium]|nr:aconitase family protein [Spirochaetota bacterium]